MSFDAFMVRAVAHELNSTLAGARVEKVLQPSKDEIFLALHKESLHFKLQINAGAQAPRIGITSESPENPKVPPMFCMLLRKHLSGAKICSVKQMGFERVIETELETYDEMGFFTKRYLITEIMGRYSNCIFCDADHKILGVVRPVDFTTSSKRQVLAQMYYEMPPTQDKKDPFDRTRESFFEDFPCGNITAGAIVDKYLGFSPLTAREILYRSGSNDPDAVYRAFDEIMSDAENGRFTPTLLLSENGAPKDFSCFSIKQEIKGKKQVFKTFGELTDGFFAANERLRRERERALSTEKLLKTVESRLEKKLELQAKELADTERKSEYKHKADLINANIYRFKGKQERLTVTDYVDDGNGGYLEKDVEITLERGMTAPATAQKLYKKYAKAKNAEIEITAQMQKARAELAYIRSVLDAVSRISGQAELDEIRAELTQTGYIRQKMQDGKNGGKSPKKKQINSPAKFVTSGGYTVLVGKNNLQNDHLTFKLASKGDYWFHVKNIPGSHTVLLCDGEMPGERDLTEAAVIAAKNSKAFGSDRADVDYTRVKNVKKPSGSRPGFVIYDNYNTATVSLIEPVNAETEKKQ